MGSINDIGGVSDPLSIPPLGGPDGWATAVKNVLGGSDVPVDSRFLTPVSSRPLMQGRNRIVNGDISVNQRNFTTGNAIYVNLNGPDQWRATGVGGTCTLSVHPMALGELGEGRQFLRIASTGQTSAPENYAMVYTPIEGVRTLQGRTVTASFWARAAAGTPTVAVEATQAFGTGGSPLVYIFGGLVTLSTAWTRYSVTFNLPTVLGKTLGTGTGSDLLQLNLWTSAGTSYASRVPGLGPQDATVDFWGVQLEEGTGPTAFEQRPYAQTLEACQRYFYRVVGPADQVYLVSGQMNSGILGFPFLTRMRLAIPAVAHNFTDGNYGSNGVGAYWQFIIPSVNWVSKTGPITVTSGAVSGYGRLVCYCQAGYSAPPTSVQFGTGMYIDFNAEL